MTVGELLSRISSRELAEWAVFYGLEPWGCDVDDQRTGIVASTIANANRDAKKRRKAYQPSEFVPKREIQTESTATPQKSWQEMLQMVEMMNAAFGGEDKRQR
ncbi:MAG TPA: hypothetical protein PLT26_14935 [Anaerolineaceae bacterium]|jgi:hypothetical protein|nr:hypothetical protein [Anaerolineaceae bacterium]